MLVVGSFDIPLPLQLHSINQFSTATHLVAGALPCVCAAVATSIVLLSLLPLLLMLSWLLSLSPLPR
jgi:hypothetical protein